jgi:hypothetical protein
MAIKNREIKDRTYALEFGDDFSVEVDCKRVSGRMELRLPDIDGRLKGGFEGYIRIERKRAGVKKTKPKVIAAGSSKNAIIKIDPDAFLFQYDHLFFVDTNTKPDPVTGEDISVTAVVHAYLDESFESDEDGHCLRYRQCDATEIRNAKVDSERLGWALLLEAIRGSKFNDPDLRIAMVGDAHLGVHKKIIGRKEPIIDGVYLPAHIDLIYASSDTGKESCLNMLMSWCDRGASHVLRHIIETNPPNPFHQAHERQPFDRSRTWTLLT